MSIQSHIQMSPTFTSYANITIIPENERIQEEFLKDSLEYPFIIEQTLASFSNQNIVIRECTTNDQWVLRIPNEISNSLSDRWQERNILTWAKGEGISLLEIRSYNLNTGYLLSRFLTGQSKSASDFKNVATLQSALNLLHHLHSSQIAPITTHFHPLNRFEVTLHIALECGYSLPNKVQVVAHQLQQFLLQISPSHFQSTPCHNDPSPENFFDQNGSLYLHDWEFASMNDPMWDLTHLSVIGQIDPETILSLYPTSDPLALEKMTFFKPFIYFNTVVWASFERQKKTSTLSEETIEILYQTFLHKIEESIKSSTFQTSLIRLGHDLSPAIPIKKDEPAEAPRSAGSSFLAGIADLSHES